MSDLQQIQLLLKEAAELMSSEKKSEKRKAISKMRQISSIADTVAATIEIKL